MSSHIHVARARAARVLVVGISALALAGAGTASATPLPTGLDPGLYVGQVVSPIPLKIRQDTNTHAPIVGTLSPGTKFNFVCKHKGQRVGGWLGGNDRWYLLPYYGGPEGNRWVSAKYVDNYDHKVPRWCTEYDLLAQSH